MKKHWTFTGKSDVQYDTYDEAVEAAKRYLGKRAQAGSFSDIKEVAILEATAFIKLPVPDLQVEKFA